MTSARRRRSSPAPSVEIRIESALWKSVPSARRALRHAMAAVPQAANTEVAVLLTDDRFIRALNRQWRGYDQATNVLSFPAPSSCRSHGASKTRVNALYGAPIPLGDIVIAYETTAREASAEGKPILHHLSHLAVHGFLHLLGYDHESHDEAETMEGLERTVLARLGIPDPYAARA
jgi:probable rRNA maturation factor